MNFLEILLFTQYYELKSKGRPTSSAKNTGILLLSVLIVLVFITVFMVFNALGMFTNIHSPLSGRTTGKLVGVVVLAACFGFLYLFYGRKDKYDRIIEKFEKLPEEEQNLIYKTGMKKFLVIFSVLLLIIVVFAFL